MDKPYINQVRLLLSVLPDIATEDAFALKGGTAINLFYRDMPRLSVDIDLTYLPVSDRETSLRDIDQGLERIAAAITERNPRVQAQRIAGGGNSDTRIVVRDSRARITIECSPVMRGTVHRPLMMAASDPVIDQFGFVEINILAFGDLYGGKLHAALDRQHPRDIFDVKLLYENEGLTDELFRVFMVYLAGSGRPMHELLAPNARIRREEYEKDFMGMTRHPVTMEALLDSQARLHNDVRKRLTGNFSAFLLSLHDAEPDFDLIGLPHAMDLPAVRWKLLNLEKLRQHNPKKHAEQRGALEDLLH